ncbi:MAG: glycosyltransferase [Bacteroidota bacterium]|nr:glycosyltransferase [Bacteroidota bacterium]
MNLKKDTLFSLLIANYNNGKFIAETIESIEKQSYKNIEIIIVDDASTDNSISIINNLRDSISNIKLYQNLKNKGCGYTKDRCVKEAAGEICGFVDPEDKLSHNAIELMVLEHKKLVNASIIFSNYYHCNEDLDIIRLKKPNFKEGKINSSQLYDRIISHFSTFKTSSYFNTKGINIDLPRAVDQDLYIKLEEVGDVFYLNQNLYFYRYHEKGISAYDNNFKALYWDFIVKREACIRRDIEQEEFFSKEFEKLSNIYKDSKDFRLGNVLLGPCRRVYSRILKLRNKLKR